MSNSGARIIVTLLKQCSKVRYFIEYFSSSQIIQFITGIAGHQAFNKKNDFQLLGWSISERYDIFFELLEYQDKTEVIGKLNDDA